MSYRARTATEALDVDPDELSAVVAVTPTDRDRRLVVAAGSFDRLDRGETVAVAEGDGANGSGAGNDSATGDAAGNDTGTGAAADLPAGWRLADDGDAAFVTADGVAATATAADRETRVETARTAGRAAAGEVDRLAESTLAAAALPRLGDAETVLLVPGSAGGLPGPTVPQAVDGFAVGLAVPPEDLRGIDDTVENRYVIRVADDVDDEALGDVVDRLVREIDPGVPVEIETSRTDGVVVADAVVEAPPEYDREAAPDARVRSTYDRESATVTIEHAGGEPIPADEFEVWHDGAEVSDAVLDGASAFAEGDETVLDAGRVATVAVRWFDADENAYYVYGRERVDREAFSFESDLDAGTVELTYEGPDEADASDLRLVHRGEDGVRTVGESFTDGTLTPGASVSVEDVAVRDTVMLEFDVETPPGVSAGSLVHYRASPPHVWVHSRAEEGTTVRYGGAGDPDGDEPRDPEEFRILVDGEPAETQFADEYDSLTGGEEVVLGQLPLGSTVAVQWHEPDDPVVVAEREVVPNTHASIEYDAEAGEVEVRHRGGRTLPASELELQVDREPAEVQPEDELDEFGPDDAFTAPVPPLSRVRLVWVGEERDHHLGGTTTARDAMAATYDVDAEAMTVEYTGERPVDPDRLRVSVSGRGEPRSPGERDSRFAEAYDELTTGDAVTVEDVGLDETVIVSVYTEFENGAASSSVAHFPASPRRGFVVDEGRGEGPSATGGDDDGSDTDRDSADGETVARYVGEVRRDPAEFRVLVDGEPAAVQPDDEYDRLTGGETVPIGDPSPGSTVTVEWTAPAETQTVTEHVIAPEATFEVTYEPESGSADAGGDGDADGNTGGEDGAGGEADTGEERTASREGSGSQEGATSREGTASQESAASQETDSDGESGGEAGNSGVVTFTHTGGDALDADDVGVVVEPGSDGVQPWDAADGEVTAGDETTVAVDQPPQFAAVVFRERRALYRKRFDRSE
nr:hypothetical protein [Halorubrum sp. CBA1125]